MLSREFGSKNKRFIEDIIDGMYDWVRVLDRDDNIIFVNRAMYEGIQRNPIGEKCYKILGRTQPCENCISRKAVFDGTPHQKEEPIGDKIFSVMSSPVKNESGETIAVVEVLHDITQLKSLQKKILEQNEKLQNDLNLARKLQCSMLPKSLPDDKIDFSFIYKPCDALGGDFLDIFNIDSKNIGIYIADVSGHGVSASMLTVFLRSSLDKQLLSPAEALTRLNRDFNRFGFNQNMYITVFYAIINVATNTITFSNAGHNVCPFIYGNERFHVLRVPGIPISDWVDNPVYIDKSEQLERSDRIFFYTDGIVEMRNDENQQFGEERLLEILLGSESSPSGTLNSIVDSACDFAGISDASQIIDDITLALLEIK